MTITLDLSPQQEAALQVQAKALGLSVEEWLLRLAGLAPGKSESIAHLQRTDPEEWARRFHEWAESHDRNTPVLSEEAMSRDSIYPD